MESLIEIGKAAVAFLDPIWMFLALGTESWARDRVVAATRQEAQDSSQRWARLRRPPALAWWLGCWSDLSDFAGWSPPTWEWIKTRYPYFHAQTGGISEGLENTAYKGLPSAASSGKAMSIPPMSIPQKWRSTEWEGHLGWLVVSNQPELSGS